MEQKETLSTKLKKFLKETARVLRITKKPNKTEFQTIVKITGLGVCVIGLIGFVIFILRQTLL